MGLQVINRNGEKEDVRFDAILERLTALCDGLDTNWVDPAHVTKLVIEGLYDGVTTRELDELAAETAAALAETTPITAVLQHEFALMICIEAQKMYSVKSSQI